MKYISLKAFIASLITHPLVGRIIRFRLKDKIPSFHIPVYAPRHAVTDSVYAAIFWRIYESAEIRFVKQYLRPDVDVIELGSSIGIVSSHIACQVSPGHKLVCVEANPDLISVLSYNLATNARHLDTVILSGCIDYTMKVDEQSKFYIGATSLSSSLTGEGKCIKIPTLTLSHVLTESKVKNYSLVMDIEGAELAVLLYDGEALKFAKQIIAELHAVTHYGVNYSIEDLIKIIENTGFVLIARRGSVCVFDHQYP